MTSDNIVHLTYSRECGDKQHKQGLDVWKAKLKERQREEDITRLANEYNTMPHPWEDQAPRGTMSWYRIDLGLTLTLMPTLVDGVGGDETPVNRILNAWFSLLAVGDTFSIIGRDDIRRTIVEKSKHGCNQALLDDGLIDVMYPSHYRYMSKSKL